MAYFYITLMALNYKGNLELDVAYFKITLLKLNYKGNLEVAAAYGTHLKSLSKITKHFSQDS